MCVRACVGKDLCADWCQYRLRFRVSDLSVALPLVLPQFHLSAPLRLSHANVFARDVHVACMRARRVIANKLRPHATLFLFAFAGAGHRPN